MKKSNRMHDRGVTFATDGDLAVHVPDLEKGEDFYSNVLRFKLSKKQMNGLFMKRAKSPFTS